MAANDSADGKVLLFLRPVGDAPALKKARYKLDGSKAIVEVERFLRKAIGTAADQPIFLYCGSGFSPTPDQILVDVSCTNTTSNCKCIPVLM
jgi:ubiquitin-like protein ATG12